MCNFNKQNDKTKAFLALFMQRASQNLGGANFLLTLVEALRASKPHPLLEKKCLIRSDKAQIKWNKTVFKDKFDTLQEIVLSHKSSEELGFNILDIESQKRKKRVLNMIKTLIPIKFTISATSEAGQNGFELEIFETIDFQNEYVTLNPVFTALFFCSTDYTKRALKFEI